MLVALSMQIELSHGTPRTYMAVAGHRPPLMAQPRQRGQTVGAAVSRSLEAGGTRHDWSPVELDRDLVAYGVPGDDPVPVAPRCPECPATRWCWSLTDGTGRGRGLWGISARRNRGQRLSHPIGG